MRTLGLSRCSDAYLGLSRSSDAHPRSVPVGVVDDAARTVAWIAPRGAVSTARPLTLWGPQAGRRRSMDLRAASRMLTLGVDTGVAWGRFETDEEAD